MATVRVSDVVVPEIFTGYAQQLTTELSALVQSGAVVSDPVLNANLAGAGLTFNEPSFKDVTNEDENVSSDDPDVTSTPKNIGSLTEIQVRLSRNQSWSSMDLAGDLIARDPMEAMARRVGNYWALRLQAAFIATMKGVFADNDAAPSGSEHVQYDLTKDVKGASYTAGVTNFTAENFIDGCVLLGDAMGGLAMICVHSIVYARMQKNNLIDFIPDSEGRVNIPTFLGRRVIVDDAMPTPSSGVYESWLFGPGVVRMGIGSPKVPTEVERKPDAGNGSGQEILYSRMELCLHPKGYAYKGTSPNGGPSNASTSNNLAHADSWQRVWPERKMIKIARLITREF